MKILLGFEQKEISRILAFALESRLHVQTIDLPSTLESAKLLESKDSGGVELIIAEGTDNADSLTQYAIAKRVKIPVILVVLNPQNKTGSFGLRHLVGAVTAELQEKMVDEIINLILNYRRELFQQNPKLAATAQPLEKSRPAVNTADKKSEGDFSRINTNLLVRVSPLTSGIYIRLGPEKFVKIFQEGDVFDGNDLKKYLSTKKIDYFYLLNSEIGEFLGKLQADLLKLLQEKKGAGLTKVGAEVNEAVHETVKELINNLGITPEVQSIVKSSMELAVKSMSRSPKLSDHINKLKLEPHKYISSHSMMLGEIACAIAHAAGWHSDATVYKLNLAAFLHDISLKNNNLASVQTLEELELRRTEFTPTEVLEYKDHPAAAAEMARQFTEVPPDVDVIVAQHHERPDGSGFPRGLTHANISPLGAAFLVGHDLLLYILKHGEGWTKDAFLAESEPKYVGGNFKKIMKVMKQMKL